jgi:hypothetical protein
MALATVANIKDYLRIEASQTAEDALLGDLRTRAIAELETLLRGPILGAARTYGPTTASYPVIGSLRGGSGDSAVAVATRSSTFASVDAHPDYSARLEALVSGWIVDTVSDRYNRRNPNASSESSGGGISVAYTANALPARVTAGVMQLRQQLGW